MKEVKHYICEICGTMYNDRAKCRECEKTHKKYQETELSPTAFRIVDARYLPMTVDKTGLPITITVEYKKDGRIEQSVYKR